jgi:hypothetical protein
LCTTILTALCTTTHCFVHHYSLLYAPLLTDLYTTTHCFVHHNTNCFVHHNTNCFMHYYSLLCAPLLTAGGSAEHEPKPTECAELQSGPGG